MARIWAERSSSEPLMVWVAPSLAARSRRLGCRSTAMIVAAPATEAAITAASPTLPVPKTAMLDPAGAPSATSTDPAPVWIPQPSGPGSSRGRPGATPPALGAQFGADLPPPFAAGWAIRTGTSPGPGSRSCTSSIAYAASAALSTAALISTVSALQGVADGQVLQAADERGGRPLRPAGQLDGFQPGQQLGEECAGLHPGEGGAEAQMDAEAEREVPVGVAADVEAERVIEDILVPVG